jgi:hypothetical protein
MDDSTSYNISLSADDDIDVVLGLLTRAWGTLEYQIIQITGTFLGVSEEEARAVLSQMNLRPRLEIAGILAPTRLIYDRDIEAFKAHRKAIEKAQETRNLLIHGLWGRAPDGKWTVLQIWGGKDGAQRIDPKPHPMDAAALDKKVGDVISAIIDLQNWWGSEPALMPSPYRDD